MLCIPQTMTIVLLLRVIAVCWRGCGTTFVPKGLGCCAKASLFHMILPFGLVIDGSNGLLSLQD